LFRLNDFWLSYGHWTYIFCSNFKLSGLFFDILWYIDLIFGMWLYLDELSSRVITQPNIIRQERNSNLNCNSSRYSDIPNIKDELQLKLEFRSGRMIFGWAMALELVFFVQILRCPDLFLTSFDIMTWTQPKVIQPEQNSNLNCNSSRYSHIPNIKSNISKDVKKKDLIFGVWLYLDELQFNLEFRSGRMIFGWAMALELVFFVQILGCPVLFLTSLYILTWYLVCGYI
jgi:hypothetical protein